jgi:hypothetical protein
MVDFPAEQSFRVNLTENTITTITWAANSDAIVFFYGPNNPNVIQLQRGAQTQIMYATKVAQQVAFQVKSANLKDNYAATFDPPPHTEGNISTIEYGFNILGTDNGLTFSVQQVTETLADLQVRFISDQDGKAGKDDDTELEASLYAANGTKLATYGQGRFQSGVAPSPGWESCSGFDEGSDITKPMKLLTQISPRDTLNAYFQMNINPNGHDS